ncbi:hypothetical protein LWF15_27285 [Kineosporia rhizophila]|uniref:hypothetical protein n=1 Tax=Kineosporia TaxID=49184 RepID=UPI000AA07D4A|nr:MULTISPECIES: hypothetical protein [Kineosporia]MCE0539209.1 hypothetical protein [Kineosporia rhizophila]GLY14522.1 hypothetical protein Kisp01_15370 [Kineosporia sp. NBRC 101677]
MIRRRVGLAVFLALAVSAAFLGANETTEGGQAALGGMGLLLVSIGSVVLARGR